LLLWLASAVYHTTTFFSFYPSGVPVSNTHKKTKKMKSTNFQRIVELSVLANSILFCGGTNDRARLESANSAIQESQSEPMMSSPSSLSALSSSSSLLRRKFPARDSQQQHNGIDGIRQLGEAYDKYGLHHDPERYHDQDDSKNDNNNPYNGQSSSGDSDNNQNFRMIPNEKDKQVKQVEVDEEVDVDVDVNLDADAADSGQEQAIISGGHGDNDLTANTQEALIRHEDPPLERNAAGDSIFNIFGVRQQQQNDGTTSSSVNVNGPMVRRN
jgi:hypothetical protein